MSLSHSFSHFYDSDLRPSWTGRQGDVASSPQSEREFGLLMNCEKLTGFETCKYKKATKEEEEEVE